MKSDTHLIVEFIKPIIYFSTIAFTYGCVNNIRYMIVTISIQYGLPQTILGTCVVIYHIRKVT